MPENVETFGTAVEGLRVFGAAQNGLKGTAALNGLKLFSIGELKTPTIKYGSFLLRYDLTAYNNDYLFYGLETSNGAYRIRRVDRNQQQTWALGAWAERENLVYS